MAMQLEQQMTTAPTRTRTQTQRQRQQQRQQTTMQSRNDYEVEWRAGVNASIRELSEATNNLAVTTKGLQEGQRALTEEMRDLKGSPGRVRDWLAVGVAIVAVVVSMASCSVYGLTLIIAHWHP